MLCILYLSGFSSFSVILFNFFIFFIFTFYLSILLFHFNSTIMAVIDVEGGGDDGWGDEHCEFYSDQSHAGVRIDSGDWYYIDGGENVNEYDDDVDDGGCSDELLCPPGLQCPTEVYSFGWSKTVPPHSSWCCFWHSK